LWDLEGHHGSRRREYALEAGKSGSDVVQVLRLGCASGDPATPAFPKSVGALQSARRSAAQTGQVVPFFAPSRPLQHPPVPVGGPGNCSSVFRIRCTTIASSRRRLEQATAGGPGLVAGRGRARGQAYAPSATPSALKEQGTSCEHGTRPFISGVSRTVAEWRLLELQTRGPASTGPGHRRHRARLGRDAGGADGDDLDRSARKQLTRLLIL